MAQTEAAASQRLEGDVFDSQTLMGVLELRTSLQSLLRRTSQN